MWTCENRAKYNRDKLHYPSDLTDEEWSHVAPLIPPAKHGGRKRKVDVREVVNGNMYVLSTGCQWRYVPKDLPPKSTLFDYFDLWSYEGTLENIHHALYVKCREVVGREASPGKCPWQTRLCWPSSVKKPECRSRKSETSGLNCLRQKLPPTTAQNFSQRVLKCTWLGELSDIILGHGVSSFNGKWRLEHPTIRRLTSLPRHQLLTIARVHFLKRRVWVNMPGFCRSHQNEEQRLC
jgi:transposase